MIVYRSAVLEDVTMMQGLLQALADCDCGGRVAPVEALRKHGFGDRPLYEAILAEEQGKSIGLVVFYPDFSTMRGAPGVYVQDLYVLDEWRGIGVGRMLLSEAMKAAELGWDARYLTLGVNPKNSAARAVYERMGFRPRGYDFLIIEGATLVTDTGSS